MIFLIQPTSGQVVFQRQGTKGFIPVWIPSKPTEARIRKRKLDAFYKKQSLNPIFIGDLGRSIHNGQRVWNPLSANQDLFPGGIKFVNPWLVFIWKIRQIPPLQNKSTRISYLCHRRDHLWWWLGFLSAWVNNHNETPLREEIEERQVVYALHNEILKKTRPPWNLR